MLLQLQTTCNITTTKPYSLRSLFLSAVLHCYITANSVPELDKNNYKKFTSKTVTHTHTHSSEVFLRATTNIIITVLVGSVC